MTVVVLTELYWPEETSTGFFLTGIAEGLAREHPVTALCAQPTYSQRGSLGPRRERRNGVEIRRVRSTRFLKDALPGRLLNMLTIGMGLFWAALRTLRPGDRAIAVTNPPLLPFLTLLAARLRGAEVAVLLHDVYPEVDYGWEKFFSERLYLAFHRNYGIESRIARYHNIFGPEGTWNGGREKAPAAICRKVAEAPNLGEIEIWGDGNQTRSFLYIDECLEGTLRLTRSASTGPFNIGSEEMVTINQLTQLVMEIAGKKLDLKHIDGPLGVQGRNSDNRLIHRNLNWKPSQPLRAGLEITYRWIDDQVSRA